MELGPGWGGAEWALWGRPTGSGSGPGLGARGEVSG